MPSRQVAPPRLGVRSILVSCAMHPRLTVLCLALLIAALLVGTGSSAPTQEAAPAPLAALLVGGGPGAKYNQVALENNIRYVSRILPRAAQRRILYGDGGRGVTVQYEDARGRTRYRRANLPQIDGPAERMPINVGFHRLSRVRTPILIYFTGHGDPGKDPGYHDNAYDLWNDTSYTVRDFAAAIAELPADQPVAVVMVQCYSGGFGQTLFEKGDPLGSVVQKDYCGFFAAMPDREAAGCTPEINEANYHDFTSYFFAALSGRDRLGRPVTGADYNHDGRVGMDEAYCYALIHDVSIDTPNCTSDYFVRRFASESDARVFATKYADVLTWANPGERAVLTALSAKLHLTAEDRLARAYRRFAALAQDPDTDADETTALWVRFVHVAKTVVLAHEIAANGTPEEQGRLAALRFAESRNPLLPARLSPSQFPAAEAAAR